MMSRQPFITDDLRPDLAVQPDSGQPTLTGHATTAQLADAALALLSDEERQQVERGSRTNIERLMRPFHNPIPMCRGRRWMEKPCYSTSVRAATTHSIGWERRSGSVAQAISLSKTSTRHSARGSKPRRNALPTIFSLS